jgi:hypothetical protein
MAEYQITCTVMSGGSGHEHITQVGASTEHWAAAAVVEMIEEQTDAFFTSVDGARSNLGVRKGPNGRKYLQTYANVKWNDDLLALPRCR